jgi:RHS repeat-associated protein
MTDEFIYFSGRKVARRTASTGAVVYFFADHLGSTRVLTNASGTILKVSDYYPFGTERIVGGSDPGLYKFTGYERDLETGHSYAIFRFHHEALGRFLTPDPLAGSVANPQSLNRYAYVLNDPLNWVDPLGLECSETYDPAIGGFRCEVAEPVENDAIGNGAGSAWCPVGIGLGGIFLVPCGGSPAPQQPGEPETPEKAANNAQDPTKLPLCTDIAFAPVKAAIEPVRSAIQEIGPQVGQIVSRGLLTAGQGVTWLSTQIQRIPPSAGGPTAQDLALYGAAASGLYAAGQGVQSVTAFVTANAGVLTLVAVDATLFYGVAKEISAAAKGQCRAF